MSGRSNILPVLVLLIGCASVAPLQAQSLFAGRGLGYVAEPIDARGRALGGIGLGLPEPTMSLINPAGVAGLRAPALHVTVQPDQFTSTFDGSEISASTVRFPLIHAALPYRRWIATIGYASYLDRNWAVERDTALSVGGAPVVARDRFASHGGVARLRLGAAYAVAPRVAVGASADVFSGSVQDTLFRVFDDPTFSPTVNASSLAFRGVGYSAGVRWVPSEAFALEASVSGGGELEVRTEATGDEVRYDLPAQAAAGLSGRVTPGTLIALSGRWSGWSSVDEAFAAQGGARDTWSLSGGVEFDAVRIANQQVPVRLGVRHQLLPFRWEPGSGDDGWATERAFTGGLGLRLAEGAAAIDAGIERGERGGDAVGITENFWRMTFSLTVLGR
jgi:hypothetical protein